MTEDTDKTYNGWTNYETWAINLWMDNSQCDRDYFARLASDAQHYPTPSQYQTLNQRILHTLIASLESHFDDAMPELDGVFADMLNAAMCEVNWCEIAEHLIESNPIVAE